MSESALRFSVAFWMLAVVGCHAQPPSTAPKAAAKTRVPRPTVSAALLPAPRVSSLALGANHTCVLIANAKLRCWGHAEFGALGYADPANIGDDETASAAPDVPAGGDVTSVVAGDTHTCAVLDAGRVRCWGRWHSLGFARPAGSERKLQSSFMPPTDIDVGEPVVELAAGFAHTCGRTAAGKVRCWGWNSEGQLGYGVDFKPDTGIPPRELGDVRLPEPARRIWAGENGTCALLETGSLSCWGLPWVSHGRDRTRRKEGQATPATVDVGGAVKQVVLGSSHACALLEDGAVRCWGEGLGMGLGNVTIGDDEPPSAVRPLDVGGKTTALTAGYAHTCALLETGALRCWGHSEYGALGYGNRVDIGDNEAPAAAGDVPVGGKVVQVAAGGSHTCALLESGALRCWGMGREGQLGYGNLATLGDDETPESAGDVPLFTAARASLPAKPTRPPPSTGITLNWEEPESASPPPSCREPCAGCRTLYDSTKSPPDNQVSLTSAEHETVRRVYEQYINSERCRSDERHLDPLAIGTPQDNGGLNDVVAGSFTAPGRKQKLVLFSVGHCGVLGYHSENWGQRLLILLENERVLLANLDTSTSGIYAVDLDNDGRTELVTWGGYTSAGGNHGWLAISSFAAGKQTVIADYPEVESSACSGVVPDGNEVESKVLYRLDPATHEVCFLEHKRARPCPKR